jgi:hypothetical protein
MALACSYPRMAPIYVGFPNGDERLHKTYSIVRAAHPHEPLAASDHRVRHQSRGDAAATFESGHLLSDGARRPEAVLVCKVHLCGDISGDRQSSKTRGRTDVARPEDPPLSSTVFRSVCQLTDYKVLSAIRAPATRPEFAEHTARFGQLGALLICKVCILGAPQV